MRICAGGSGGMHAHSRALASTRARVCAGERDADFLGHNANRARKRARATLFHLSRVIPRLALKIEATHASRRVGTLNGECTGRIIRDACFEHVRILIRFLAAIAVAIATRSRGKSRECIQHREHRGHRE